MSAKTTSAKDNGHETADSAVNGTLGKQDGVISTEEVDGEEGEESDEYDEYDGEEDVDYEEGRQIVGDEDDDEGEYEEEAEGANGEQPNSLTSLLIENPNAPAQGHDEEEDEEEEEDDEYMEPPTPTTKKRTIEEVGDEDESTSQGAKKIKA